MTLGNVSRCAHILSVLSTWTNSAMNTYWINKWTNSYYITSTRVGSVRERWNTCCLWELTVSCPFLYNLLRAETVKLYLSLHNLFKFQNITLLKISVSYCWLCMTLEFTGTERLIRNKAFSLRSTFLRWPFLKWMIKMSQTVTFLLQ